MVNHAVTPPMLLLPIDAVSSAWSSGNWEPVSTNHSRICFSIGIEGCLDTKFNSMCTIILDGALAVVDL